MDIKKSTGHRIRELRNELGLTQEKLSFKSGIDKTYISEVENGKRNISIINLEKLIKALDVKIINFFNNPIFS